MTPFEWSMLILSALGTASSMTAGQDVETEAPAPTPQAGGFDPAEFMKAMRDQPQSPLASVADIPTLAGPAGAATQAAATIPKTKITPPTPLPGTEVAKAATQGKVEIPAPVPPQEPPPDIGAILAAIPDALAAAAPLLGLNDQAVSTQRAAPIAGGGGGGLVGRFARGPGGIDIGQLLAALPGIRG